MAAGDLGEPVIVRVVRPDDLERRLRGAFTLICDDVDCAACGGHVGDDHGAGHLIGSDLVAPITGECLLAQLHERCSYSPVELSDRQRCTCGHGGDLKIQRVFGLFDRHERVLYQVQ